MSDNVDLMINLYCQVSIIIVIVDHINGRLNLVAWFVLSVCPDVLPQVVPRNKLPASHSNGVLVLQKLCYQKYEFPVHQY